MSRCRTWSMLFVGLALVVLASLPGCAHYHLGTGASPAFASLYLAPVQNPAGVPQAAATVSIQLREAFLRDGRVALATSPAEADAVLVPFRTARLQPADALRTVG